MAAAVLFQFNEGEIMKHIVSPLTLIDLLGIFIPGAVLVLVINVYTGNVADICTRFFGENDLMLCIFFAAISYICGSMLHEIGWRIEKLLCKAKVMSEKVKQMHKENLENPAVKAAYGSCFGEDPSIDYLAAGKKVFAYVQKKERPSRILIFHAFYTMSRTFVAAAFVILIIEAFAVFFSYEKYIESFPWVVLCVCIPAAVFLSRWIRFEKKCINESYMLFVTENHNASDPQSNGCVGSTDL